MGDFAGRLTVLVMAVRVAESAVSSDLGRVRCSLQEALDLLHCVFPFLRDRFRD